MITESWFIKYWRPAAAWVYLSICVFDFVIMPVYHLNSQGSLDRVWELSMRLRPEDQLSAVVQLTKKTTWEPITLHENAMFHLSFGAILGVAAWTRGKVQEAQVKNNPYPNSEDIPDSQPASRPPRS
jgi:hypothetical protein